MGTHSPGRRWRTVVLMLSLLASLAGAARAGDAVMVFFYGQGCPHCAAARPELEELSRDPRVTLLSFEVYGDASNRRLFAAAGHAFGFAAGSVPTILVGDEVYVGYSEAVSRRLRERVARCLELGCPDPMDRILAAAGIDAPAGTPATAAVADAVASQPPLAPLELPLVGRVALAGRSELATTALIALVDGFNPCSLWVLSLLLAVVINTRSRRKVLLVGTTFLLVAAAVYALMLAGLVNVLGLVAVLPWVRVAVALLALGFALVNLKDYVWYKQGLSLTIPEGRKPGIYRGIRGIMEQGRTSTLAMVGATAAMAAGVSVFELPCTVGFPVLWADLVLQWRPGALAFGGLLGVYLIVFLIDELVLFGAAVTTLRVTRLAERDGRLLKLFGGMVMLFLAGTMLLRPGWMNALRPATAVVGAALVTAVLVHLLVLGVGRANVGAGLTGPSGPGTPAGASRGGRRAPRERRGQ